MIRTQVRLSPPTTVQLVTSQWANRQYDSIATQATRESFLWGVMVRMAATMKACPAREAYMRAIGRLVESAAPPQSSAGGGIRTHTHIHTCTHLRRPPPRAAHKGRRRPAGGREQWRSVDSRPSERPPAGRHPADGGPRPADIGGPRTPSAGGDAARLASLPISRPHTNWVKQSDPHRSAPQAQA